MENKPFKNPNPVDAVFTEHSFTDGAMYKHILNKYRSEPDVYLKFLKDIMLNRVLQDINIVNTEQLDNLYDFVVSRAVTTMPNFVGWVRKSIVKNSRHALKNGILYLKGGDLKAELQTFPNAVIYDLRDHFSDSFFDTKKLVHLPLEFSS